MVAQIVLPLILCIPAGLFGLACYRWGPDVPLVWFLIYLGVALACIWGMGVRMGLGARVEEESED